MADSDQKQEEISLKDKLRSIGGVFKPSTQVLRFLCCIVLSGMAFGLYRGIQDNYLADIIHITPFERGIVEFFRELPGLLVVFILALMYKFTANKIFKISTAIMMGGMAGLLLTSMGSFFQAKFIVVIFMVLFSTGEHIIMPVRTAITLDFAKREKAGASLGIVSSVTNIGNILGFIIVTVLFFMLSRFGFTRTDIFGFRLIFGLSLALAIASTMVILALKDNKTKTERQRFYFHKKFRKFYMLEVFYGARKQIFLTFAPYVLILEYRADPSIMSFLYTICAAFGILLAPFVGKLIDRLGYKVVMVGDTIILVFVCLLYGFAHRLFPVNIAFIIVCANFILDSIITMGQMAANVYVQRISSNQEEITATLSTGVSVNHLISILIALLGGLIWDLTGIEVLFTLSAILGLINSFYAMTIKKSEEVS